MPYPSWYPYSGVTGAGRKAYDGSTLYGPGGWNRRAIGNWIDHTEGERGGYNPRNPGVASYQSRYQGGVYNAGTGGGRGPFMSGGRSIGGASSAGASYGGSTAGSYR